MRQIQAYFLKICVRSSEGNSRAVVTCLESHKLGNVGFALRDCSDGNCKLVVVEREIEYVADFFLHIRHRSSTPAGMSKRALVVVASAFYN